MKRMMGMAVLAGLVVTTAWAAEVKYPLSGDNTKVTFVGTKTNPNGKHNGGFKTLKGTATIDGSDVTTLKIEVEIDMNSTYADVEKLTNHLKSPDFFGVKNNPTSKFVTTKIEKSDDGYKVTGKLTLNGKTKEVTFPAKIEAKADSLTLTSEFKINRHDWGVSYGKGKVDDDVTLAVKVNAKK